MRDLIEKIQETFPLNPKELIFPVGCVDRLRREPDASQEQSDLYTKGNDSLRNFIELELHMARCGIVPTISKGRKETSYSF